jgi:hypothetical protein
MARKRGRRPKCNTLLAVLTIENIRKANHCSYKQAIMHAAKHTDFVDKDLVDNIGRYRRMRLDVEKGRSGFRALRVRRK